MFSSLHTVGFRNLADSETDIKGKDIFLVGKNGQGKSNFLEALYFCAYASSFRGAKDREMVRNDEKNCAVLANFDNYVYKKVQVKIENGKKSVFIDEKRSDDRKDLLEIAPSIIFCHEDMDFVTGGPEQKRWFFDQSQSLYDILYLDDLRKYRKILKTRNTLLKDEQNTKDIKPLLDAIDPQMAFYGFNLMEKRREAAQKFSDVFEPLYRQVSDIEGISVVYNASWKGSSPDEITAYLAQHREGDLNMGSSLSGPHRDRYQFIRKGQDFAEKASTGQRRLLALLLRVAQAARYSEVAGKNPILLLDDVLLEMDGEKRKKFLSIMPCYDQAFYTFLPEEPFDRYRKSDTIVYYVKEGYLEK
jgi:DNA replication and repair protein RecF